MIAYCGIKCSDCQILHATRDDSEKARIEVAKIWSKQFGWDLKAGDINCEGCLSEGGKLFSYCETCDVRKCAGEKAVENCAHCADFACDKLNVIWELAPEAKTNLEEIRKRSDFTHT